MSDEPKPTPHVRIPVDVFDAFPDIYTAGCVCDLYRHADRQRYSSFDAADGWLASRWNLSKRQVRAIVATMERRGFLVIEHPGTSTAPRLIRVVRCGNEVNRSADRLLNRSADRTNDDETPDIDDERTAQRTASRTAQRTEEDRTQSTDLRPQTTHTPTFNDTPSLRPADTGPSCEHPPQEQEPCTTTTATPTPTPAGAPSTAGPTAAGEDSSTQGATASLLPLALTSTAPTPGASREPAPVAAEDLGRLAQHVPGGPTAPLPDAQGPQGGTGEDVGSSLLAGRAPAAGERAAPASDDAEAAGRLAVPADASVLTPKPDPLPALWAELDAIRLGWAPGRSRKLSKALRPHLAARVADHGADAVSLVWAWVWQSPHKRAEFLRGHDDATTLLRPGNLAKYLTWSQEWDAVGRPQAPRPVASPTGKAYPSPAEAAEVYQLARRTSGTPPEHYHPDPVVSDAIRAASQAFGGWRQAGQMTPYDASRAYAQGGPFQTAYSAAINTSAKQAAK